MSFLTWELQYQKNISDNFLDKSITQTTSNKQLIHYTAWNVKENNQKFLHLDWIPPLPPQKYFHHSCCCQSLSHVLVFCDPMDYSPPGSSLHGISQARTGVGCHFPLLGIFQTQGSHPVLLHWEADSLPLKHLGSPPSLSALYKGEKKIGKAFSIS